MAKGSINVEVITKEMMAMAINDTVQSGAVAAISIVNNRDLVGNIIVHYFMSQNLFREILGLPLYVLPESETENDDDDE